MIYGHIVMLILYDLCISQLILGSGVIKWLVILIFYDLAGNLVLFVFIYSKTKIEQ